MIVVILLFTENLERKYPSLISHMENAGYSTDYVGRIKREVEFILATAASENWISYDDVRRYYETAQIPSKALKKKLTFLGAIMDFDHKCRYPDGKRSGLARNDAYAKLLPVFQGMIDWYMSKERGRGKKESSINTESKNVAPFLLSLQRAGIARLCDITETAVVQSFVSADGMPLRGASNRKFIVAFFRACMPLDQDGCKKALALIPALRKAKRNVQFLTALEARAILDALDDMSNGLTLRDRAIGKLAYYTAMRSCDIAALDLSSIDWVRDIIKVRQQKTDAPLELPLSAIVGNAIHDYRIGGRPSVGCPALFITTGKPHKRMHSNSMWGVSARIMGEAAIRQSDGDRKGLHLFRHNLATTLLGNGAQQPVISVILGQAYPESLEAYLSTDIVHLRECALSIGRFPVSGEVFADA